MIICPNFSNPEVAREFEELKNATSEAAAYHIWSLNNGNAIDRAPNGAPSKLFLTLLEYYEGDRTKAIQAKAKVYGNSFLNWFGDWTGNATYEVYQGRTSELPDGRRYNYWSRYENEAKTYGSNIRKVRINPTGFLFKNEQRWRTNLNGERVFDWGWSEEYEKVFAEFKEKTGYDYFDILENSKEGLAKQNEFFEFLESKGYKGYAEFNELELQGVEHDNAYTVTFGDNGVIDSDVSKVVDENGEPLVVWHGGAKDIRIFKHSTDDNTTTGTGYYTDPKTGEKIPVDSVNAMFFSSNRFVGTSYASLYGINTFSRIRAKVETLIGYLADPLWFFKESGEGLRFKLLFKNSDKDLIDLLDDLSVFNSRFENLKNYYIQITSQNKKLNDNEKKAFRDMLIQVRKTLYDYTSKWLMGRSEWEYVYDRAIRLIDEYNNTDGIKRLINGEIPETIKKEWELYKNIEQQREKEGKSKIANYEELDITLGEGRYYLSYNGNELSLWTPDYSDPKVSDMTEEQLSLFLTDAKSAAKHGILSLKDDEIYLRIKNKALEYPVFLNVKNPLVHDYEGTHQGQGYKESQKYPFGYVAARQVRKAILSGNDGVIYLNLYDPYLADNYGVMAPNLIKSIDNQGPTPWEGTYSRENDDIYYNLKYLKLNTIDDYKTLFENILRDYYDFHRWHGLRETISKSTRNINKKDILKILSWFNLPSGTIYLNEFGTGVKFNDTLLSENLDNLKDLIQDTTPIDIVQAVRVIKMFLQKFPQIKGVKFATSDKWNGKFENGYVYLNPKTFTSVAIEECLHPFVEALFDENPQLFDNLLKQAQKEFKTLRLQIANSYKDKKGFTVEDRQKELVTQALSKHLANIINNKEKQDSIWKKALNWILNKFGLNDISQISEKTTLQELAEQIYDANNINIDDKYFDVQKYNINAKNTSDVVTPSLRQQLTEELQQLDQKHQTLLNNFGLDDKNNPIFVLDKIGEKHGIDIQVKGNVVKSEILFPTDWFVYLLKSNVSLDEGTVKSLNEDLDHINYELLSLNAELENGSWYFEEIGEWFKFDESSKLFKRDRILQLLKDKKHIESLLEKHNTQQNVVQNKISEYRQLLYNLLFYLHSIGLNTVKSTDFFNSLSPLDLYIENYDLSIISEIVNNIQYLVGKEALNKCFSISDDYILVDVEGLLEHVKQNYEVSVKNSIISDIKDVISGKYRRTAEDRQIFEQEVEKILTLKQELQNLLDDLQKTERELDLKDYLKSLRNTLDC